jgi:hypothetical protein
MKRVSGLDDPSVVVQAFLYRLVEHSRGGARRLALAVSEQVMQLMTIGMGIDEALREALRTAMVAAQLRMEQCSGYERLAFEDLVNLCQEAEARIRTIETL